MTSSKPKDYAASLCRLMESKDDTRYEKDKKFSTEELLAIRPEHVVEWFNEMAYGKKTPDPDDRPTKCRSNTLLNHKKKVSWFHPRKDQQWDSIRGEGNPTRSQSVNSMIALVKHHEVRQTGVRLQARRAFTHEEFLQLLAVTDAITNNEERSARFHALVTLQWQLIGRVDDMQKTQVSNFGFDADVPQALTVQLRWSKNIREEKASPTQIVVGSGDAHMCALLHLAAHLELTLQPSVTTGNTFIFGNGANMDTAACSIIT